MGDTAVVKHRVACSTHIGRTHRKNQDSGGAWTWERDGGVPLSLAVVADGVSSGPRSEQASKLAVETIHGRVDALSRDPDTSIDALIQAVEEGAREASRRIAEQSAEEGMAADATTLTAAICRGDEAGGVWCGDSRVYHLHAAGATRLTRDHSWAESIVSHGILTEEQASRDPRAHMITSWLGPQDPQQPMIDTFRLRLKPGEALLCCSDGLYAYFTAPHSEVTEMARIVLSAADAPGAALDQLVDIALARGGHDDITAAAIALDASEPAATPPRPADAVYWDETLSFSAPLRRTDEP